MAITPVTYIKMAVGVGAAIGVGMAALRIAQQNANNTVNSFNNPNTLFKFPYNLPEINGTTYGILFNFYKYDRPSIMYPPTLIPYGSIVLPLPADMIDNLGLDYAQVDSKAAPMVGAALENTKNIIDGITSPNLNSIQNFLSEGVESLGLSAVDSAAGATNVAKGLQLAGVAQNPFLTMLFNSPKFKQFTFKWTFIPENAADSEMLRTIIDKFRYHALPDVVNNTAGLLLTYPDMCIPVIYPNPYMFNMKQCVVESINVNYAPGTSTAAFFPSTNAPNAISVTLNLLEIEIWTKQDLLNPAYHTPTFISGGASITS